MEPMTRNRWLGLRSGAVLLLCWFAPALAVTVAPVDFSGLVAKAELIFTGKVVSTRSEWNGQGNERCIVTFVTFDVGPRVPLREMPVIQRRVDISATEVRKRVAQGYSIRYLVPDAVCAIIETHRLYQGDTH